jgi:hypothetical protein
MVTCEEGAGIVPGFEEVDAQKWLAYPKLLKKYKHFMEDPPEDEHTDGGHACALQYNFIEAFGEVSKVKEIPSKARYTNLFDELDEYLEFITDAQKRGCDKVIESVNWKESERTGKPIGSKLCGKPIGTKRYDRCDDHLHGW